MPPSFHNCICGIICMIVTSTFNNRYKIKLVKNEIAEPILYGGEIKKFFKTISFPGWFKVAGAIDAQGNYEKGFEHLGTQRC